MANHDIQGKTVLVAGGAKNLGGLIARDLARHGAKAVVIHYNSAGTKQAADETAAAIKQTGAERSSIPPKVPTRFRITKRPRHYRSFRRPG